MNQQKIREDIIYLARHQPDLALQQADDLVEDHPEEAWAWSLRSDVYDTRGDFEHAMSDIDYAIYLRFDEPSSHFSKAKYLVAIRNFEDAIYSFSNVIEISGKIQWLYYESACRFVRAYCYCRIGDYEAARYDLNCIKNDDFDYWIDRLRSKAELLEACEIRYLD
jgi:tetratricopeptide (TPR) repeat protein